MILVPPSGKCFADLLIFIIFHCDVTDHKIEPTYALWVRSRNLQSHEAFLFAEKMKINIDVPSGKSGEWEISRFTVSEEQARFENLRSLFSSSSRYIAAGEYVRLSRSGHTIMSNTPVEIADHYEFIRRAMIGGSVLINGLGLGMCLAAILESDKVSDVTVIEKSIDVIALVAPTYTDSRVRIINGCAFDYKPEKGKRFSCVWHDIWDDITSDNLPQMKTLHRKYGRIADWQGSWARALCERIR